MMVIWLWVKKPTNDETSFCWTVHLPLFLVGQYGPISIMMVNDGYDGRCRQLLTDLVIGLVDDGQ